MKLEVSIYLQNNISYLVRAEFMPCNVEVIFSENIGN